MKQQSTRHKILILIVLAPCLAAASLLAQMPSMGMTPGAGSNPDNSFTQRAGPSGGSSQSDLDDTSVMATKGSLLDLANNALAETDLSRLALTNSGNDNVKKLAQQVIADHQKLDGGVSAIASNLMLTLPQKPSKHLLKQEKKMQSMTGSEFDQVYLKELNHDVAQDKNNANQEILATNSPNTRQLMLEVKGAAQNCGKLIANVGKAENLKLK